MKIKNRKLNSEMSVSDIKNLINIEQQALDTLTKSAERLALSGRAFHRVLKVAQTIADLEGIKEVKREHVLEALQYRQRS